MKKQLSLMFLCVLLALLVGCAGTLEVGVEQTPTPDRGVAATISALVADNARLATQVAALTTPSAPAASLGRLAYVQGGDIWVKVLPDGRPQRLTTDGHNNREPRWSASGHWLAFQKEVDQEVPCDIPNPRTGLCAERVALPQQQLWVMGADGSSAHILNPGDAVESFAWSPTEDRLAYVTAGGELQAVNADGSNMMSLTPHPMPDYPVPGRVDNISWSPNGQWIAYEWRIQQADPQQNYQGLWKIPAEGGVPVELYPGSLPRKGDAILAGWSPGSDSLYFWQADTRTAQVADGISLYSVSATKPISKTNPQVRIESDVMLAYSDFVAPTPVAQPGAARQAVALVVGSGRGTWTNKRIQVNGQALTPPDIAAISPAWSPDGTRLAYAGMPDHPDLAVEAAKQELMQRRIGVVSMSSNTSPRWVTDSPAYRDERPLWSSDGSTLLFARLDLKGRASLWIIPAAGGASRQVVDELTPVPDSLGRSGHVDWDGLFDWWRGPAESPATLGPVAQSTSIPISEWTTYTNTALHVSLQFPSTWRASSGSRDRYESSEGFFQVAATAGQWAQIVDACASQAARKPQSYGSKPQVEKLQLQSGEACLVSPSDDQAPEMLGQATVVLRYPQPIQAGGQVYTYLIVTADKDHIRPISRTIKLTP